MKTTYEQAIEIAKPLNLMVGDNGNMALMSSCGYGVMYWQCWASEKPEYVDNDAVEVISNLATVASRVGEEKLVEIAKQHHREQSDELRKRFGLDSSSATYEIKSYEYNEGKGWEIPYIGGVI